MSGLLSAGVDLDTLLELRGAGDPQRAAVGIRNAGADISARYLPAAEGDPGPATGIRSNGSDIGPMFCAKGTRLQVDTRTVQATASASGVASTNCSATIQWNGPSTGRARGIASSSTGGGSATPEFSWLIHGNPGDFQIMVSLSSGDTPTGSALGSWLSLGGGVISFALNASASGGSADLKFSSGSYQIRRAVGGTIVGTGTWSLRAEASSL